MLRHDPKRLIFLGLIGMAIASGLSGPLHAYHLGISPARLRLSVEPGRTLEGTITVNGEFSEPARIRVSAGDWDLTPRGEVFYPEPGRVQRSLTGWLMVSPAEFVLGPNKTQVVRYRLQAPTEISGTYWGAIFFRNVAYSSQRAESGVGITTSARIGLLIDATAKRGGIADGRITGMQVELAGKTASIRADFANSGNTLLRLEGRFEIKDLKTGKVAARIPVGDTPVLPGGTRQIAAEWAGSPGAYLALCILDYGGRNVVVGQRAFKIG